ncbi:hypothetical protein LCGC14_2678960 [marine sediment metagenome]|uniref:Uncharacterized protein n=1 Tax=marine sediment metagenome TaxID=412755 RepID=A0A0F8ZLU4_9ZZZZ
MENELTPNELHLEDVEQDIQKEELDRIAKREVEATTKTTRFVNVDNEVYNLRINGQIVRTLKPGEEAVLPLFVATVGSKHLVDRILKKMDKAVDTNRDTPIRRSIFAKILPDLASERKITPLTQEEEMESLKEEIKRNQQFMDTEFAKRDNTKEVDALKKELSELKKLVTKGQKTTKQ